MTKSKLDSVLKNLTDAQLLTHLSDEAAELHERAAVLHHRVDRAQRAQLVNTIDGVGATLRRVTALRDELAARGIVK